MSGEARDPADSAETIFAAWLTRVESGEDPDLEPLLKAHPEHTEGLRRLHDDWRLFAPLLGRAVPGRMEDGHGIVLAPLSGSSAEAGEPPSRELLERLGIEVPQSGRYRFRSVLGRGGGGIVLKVWDAKLNRPLAMKIVLGRGEERPTCDTPKVDGLTLTRFVDEARITSQLNHPGIVPVHELGLDESGRAFFTMKLVRGEELGRIFEHVRNGHDGWNQTRALNVLLRVCESVAFAHEKGVIHRDLKPANVMVGRHGEVYVTDWGLARVLCEADRKDVRVRPPTAPSALLTTRAGPRTEGPDSPLYTMDGDVVGTPAYMSPEQAAGDLARMGPHSDVYAVGAMLYHLLTGQMPYVPPGARLNNYAVWQRVQEGPPNSIESIAPRAPVELVAICEKAMAREIRRRYSDMQALASDLRAFLEGRVVSAHKTGAWAETKKWVRRNKALAGAVASAFVLAVMGVLAFSIKAREADERANEAQVAQGRAERGENEARWNAYVAAITGASAARNVDDAATVRRLLDSAPDDLRNWEWHNLNAESDTSLLVLPGDVAVFSPDGRSIVTGSGDGTSCMWDASSGELLRRLEVPTDAGESVAFSLDGARTAVTAGYTTGGKGDPSSREFLRLLTGRTRGVTSAAFSPDGSGIVAGSGDGTARLWDANSGELQRCLAGHGGWVTTIVFSADGKRIVTGSGDGMVRVWDAGSGGLLWTLDGHTDIVDSVDLSPDGTRIVVAAGDMTARMWDANSGEFLRGLEGHTDAVYSVAFSLDGTRIVTGSLDDTACVWDASSGELLRRLEGHTGGITSVAFSPDGTRIVTGSSGDSADVWDASSGELQRRLEGHTGRITSVAFNTDGTRIVTAAWDNTARVWDASSGELLCRLEGHTGRVSSAAFSFDGTRIITAAWDNTVRVWDTNSREVPQRLSGHTLAVMSVVFSPDGTRIVTGSWDNTACVWDANSGEFLWRLEGHTGGVVSIAFSADCTRIVTGSGDGMVRVWDASSGELLRRLEGHTRGLTSTAFSPDGSRFVTVSLGKAARVWDASSGGLLRRLEGHTGRVCTAAFSLDGTRIVTGSSDRTARVWDAESGELQQCLEGHTDAVYSVAFNPDGTRIVTGSADGTARLWDANSGELQHCLEGHTDAVDSVAFSPDGTRIVTGSGDGAVRVWDSSGGELLRRLEGHTGRVNSVTFSPDGTRIVTGSSDSTARVWDAIPYRDRLIERKALELARPAAERALSEALAKATDLVAAGARLRDRGDLDLAVRRTALDLLLTRLQEGRVRADDLVAKRSHRIWTLRVLGREAWPAETAMEAELASGWLGGPDDLNSRAWELVDPDAPLPNEAMRAMVLTRHALNMPDLAPASRASYCDTLAWALFWLGRFDEALENGEMAIEEANTAQEDVSELRGSFERLKGEIAKYRDESGALRHEVLETELRSLEQRIAELEADPWVQRWVASQRVH